MNQNFPDNRQPATDNRWQVTEQLQILISQNPYFAIKRNYEINILYNTASESDCSGA